MGIFGLNNRVKHAVKVIVLFLLNAWSDEKLKKILEEFARVFVTWHKKTWALIFMLIVFEDKGEKYNQY